MTALAGCPGARVAAAVRQITALGGPCTSPRLPATAPRVTGRAPATLETATILSSPGPDASGALPAAGRVGSGALVRAGDRVTFGQAGFRLRDPPSGR